jgi:uridine kinase
MNNKVIIIGIAGGSGSGKTRLVKNILTELSDTKTTSIEIDSYYKDLSHLSFQEREKNNFDHPNSIDFELLYKHLKEILNNKKIETPLYNYKEHIRDKNNIKTIEKNVQIILLEGIFALYNQNIRDIMEIKIFVDTPSDIRILRRIKRDVNKRKRTIESVIEQYNKTVRPMFMKYVKPTKEYADLIIPYGGKNKISIDTIVTKIKKYYI